MFSVEATDTMPRLDPRTLWVRGHPDCLPAVATEDVAIFKIPTTACGAGMRVRSATPPPPLSAPFMLPLVTLACPHDNTLLFVLF